MEIPNELVNILEDTTKFVSKNLRINIREYYGNIEITSILICRSINHKGDREFIKQANFLANDNNINIILDKQLNSIIQTYLEQYPH